MTGSAPSGARVVVTGAAGSLARDVLPGLVEHGFHVVGVDRITPSETAAGEWFECSVTDRSALRPALEGADAVIHLAGIPLEDDWQTLLRENVDGTQAVLDVARDRAVPRAVLASSIHAAGYVPVPDSGTLVADDVPVRPNTFYGVSKAAVEALGSLYHDRYGMDVICLRIASRFAEPQHERMLSTWLSPADAVRLLVACLTTEAPGYRVVWGVSANTRAYLSPDGGAAIGFSPQDDAEQYAAALLEATPARTAVRASEWDRRYIGGVFSSPEPPRQPPTYGVKEQPLQQR